MERCGGLGGRRLPPAGAEGPAHTPAHPAAPLPQGLIAHLHRVLARYPPPAPTEAAVRLVESVGKLQASAAQRSATLFRGSRGAQPSPWATRWPPAYLPSPTPTPSSPDLLQDFVFRHGYDEAAARLNSRDIFGQFVHAWIANSTAALRKACASLEAGSAHGVTWQDFNLEGAPAAHAAAAASDSRRLAGPQHNPAIQLREGLQRSTQGATAHGSLQRLRPT